MGPSEFHQEVTKYVYLEFRNAGRVHNVGVMSDLLSKFKQSLGKEDCSFHLMHGENLQTGDPTCVLVAVGEADGTTCAVDMKRRGADAMLASARKMRTMGRVLQYLGLGVALIGIPMILIFVGILVTVLGILMWRNGKKVANACQYQVDMLEMQMAMVSRMSGVRLL